MGYVIIHTNKKEIANSIWRFLKEHPNLVAKSFNFGSNNNKFCTAILKNNGIVWSWVASIMSKYKVYEFHVFYCEWMDFPSLPEEFKDGGRWLAENPKRNIRFLPNKEKLEKMELDRINIKLKHNTRKQ